ncbi:MAG: MerR family transcriptional regulator [Chloroflexi bacterium]|nr:MerR family transcriptional regulator [Chloroflexota bacterium]
MNDQTFGFTIKLVAERTGVSVHTLRAWERRYGVPKPNRGAENRYRLYGEDDVADVLWLKQQVESGIPPAQASAFLRQRHEQPRGVALSEAVQPIAATQTALLDAFAQSDETAARRVLDEAFALFAPEQVALQIIEPTMREIGARWMRNELTVWQEHLASNLVQQKLYAILQSQPTPPMGAPSLVAACAPNEEHTLGLLTFALLAQRQGWRVIFLGQGTPLADLNDIARTAKPNVVVVTVTTVIGLAGLIPWLDAAQRPRVKLVFGGRIVDASSTLREHLPGEYLGADVDAAARDLVAFKPRAKYWSPSKRVWIATNALRAQRLKLAGDTVARFMAALSPNLQPKWNVTDLNRATLFLADALVCALAFDAPELMDAERAWLDEMMPSRAVTAELLDKHIETFARVLAKAFPQEQNRLYQPLVARIKS